MSQVTSRPSALVQLPRSWSPGVTLTVNRFARPITDWSLSGMTSPLSVIGQLAGALPVDPQLQAQPAAQAAVEPGGQLLQVDVVDVDVVVGRRGGCAGRGRGVLGTVRGGLGRRGVGSLALRRGLRRLLGLVVVRGGAVRVLTVVRQPAEDRRLQVAGGGIRLGLLLLLLL